MTQLLDVGKVTLPLLARLHADDDREGMAIVATALVRGQGKTEGLHRRSIRTSWEEEAEDFGEVTVFDQIGSVAIRRTQEAIDASRILTRALSQVMQGGPKDADVRGDDRSTKARAEPWTEAFDIAVDAQFFDEKFWMEVKKRPGQHRKLWRGYLATVVSQVFEEAFESGPRSEARRLRPWARARNYLDRKLNSWMEAAEHVDAS